MCYGTLITIERGNTLTAFLLKMIAVITMLIDHIGAVFRGFAPVIFRSVGRIAFPIFAYMIAQSCLHTKSLGKYLLRLGIFAVVSEVPFDLAFRNNISFISKTNIFYTLFLGVACITLYEKLKSKSKILAVLPALPLIFLAEVLGADYGAFGVILIFLLYLAYPKKRITRAVILTVGMAYLYGLSFVRPWYFLFSLAAVLMVLLYNGKEGVKAKWAFYAFYPLHLVLLVAILRLGFI